MCIRDSYYTGASNLFRYNFETKKMDVISNAETGLFRPLPLADGSLIAFEYTSKGFIPARVPTPVSYTHLWLTEHSET